MKLLFLTLFLIFPFGQLTKLPLNFPGVNVYLQDLVIGLIGLIWGGEHFLKKRKLVRPPLTAPILAFAGVAFLSWLLALPEHPLNETLVAGGYLLRWIVYSSPYFVVCEISKSLNLYISKLLIMAGTLTALFALLQYLLLPDTRFLYLLGWDDHYYRAIGTFLDPGFLGMILVFTLILIASSLFDYKSQTQNPKPKTNPNFQNPNGQNKKILNFLLGVVCYLAFALTYSRSSYLAYLVGMGVIAWKLRKPKFYAVILAVFIFTLVLLPRPAGEGVQLGRKASVVARTENWQQALIIAKDHPLFGVGFNFYRYAQRAYGFLGEDWQTSHSAAGADNSFLFILATTGLIGLAAYSFLWSRALFPSRFSPPTSKSATSHFPPLISTPVVLASSSALLVHSFFHNSLFYPWIMIWFWVLLGLNNKRE